MRNQLWVSWLRRPRAQALFQTVTTLRRGFGDPAARAGLLEAMQGLAWVLNERRVIPLELEQRVRRLEAAG